MNDRENLLWAGYNQMKEIRSNVVVWKTIGDSNPPDTYHVTYNLKSLIGFDADDQPLYHKGFSVEIVFPMEYPRISPDVRFINKPMIYHPNIWVDGRFDSGFFYGENGESILDPVKGIEFDLLCQVVGEVIAFQLVNLYTPANGSITLLDWAKDNLHFKDKTRVVNPIDPTPILLPDIKSETASIFISYSHRDSNYAHRLAEALENKNCNVWIDDRIDYGTHWPRVLQDELDKCRVFIVIMSPNSYQSDWVQSELSRAKRKKKIIFTLLLEGNEPWLSVESMQYVDVTNKGLPPPKFFEQILDVLQN